MTVQSTCHDVTALETTFQLNEIRGKVSKHSMLGVFPIVVVDRKKLQSTRHSLCLPLAAATYVLSPKRLFPCPYYYTAKRVREMFVYGSFLHGFYSNTV